MKYVNYVIKQGELGKFQNVAFEAFINQDFERSFLLYMFSGMLGFKNAIISASFLMEHNYVGDFKCKYKDNKLCSLILSY